MISEIEAAKNALVFANVDLFEESPSGSGMRTLREDWHDRYWATEEKLRMHYSEKVNAEKAALRIEDEIFQKILWETAEAEKTTDLDLSGLLEMLHRLRLLAVLYGKPLGTIRPSNIAAA